MFENPEEARLTVRVRRDGGRWKRLPMEWPPEQVGQALGSGTHEAGEALDRGAGSVEVEIHAGQQCVFRHTYLNRKQPLRETLDSGEESKAG